MEVIIISLPERLNDRLMPLMEYLNNEGVDYVVVNAIKKENGMQGLIETTKNVYQLCLDSKEDYFLILEDDVKFIVDKPFEQLEGFIEELPDDFDLLYLGCNLFQDNVKLYSPKLIKVTDAWAAHAIIYSRKGIEKSLNALIGGKYLINDEALVKAVQVEGKSFCTFPILCSQISSYSDIMKRNVNYSDLLIERFFERTKNIA